MPNETPSERRIFISHTHADKQIADAINGLIEELFGKHQVLVRYSSSKDRNSGIRPGDQWLPWIFEEVRQARLALILLTPASVQKPWILWESGAVAGTAIATQSGQASKVRPLNYKLSNREIPSPFQHLQISRGDLQQDAEEFFYNLIRDLELEREIESSAIKTLHRATARYVENVQKALLNAPITPTEAVVEEWCVRLDQIKEDDRASEVRQVHEWLNVAFGKERDGSEAEEVPGESRLFPIDVRLHRRLGQLYLRCGSSENAIEQFDLARRLAPRDIFILRSLGQAQLNAAKTDPRRFADAGEVIQWIEKLDERAFIQNQDCATLKGRWHRDQKEFGKAAETYEKALQCNPHSYYLADLAAQMRVLAGDMNGAREMYTRAAQIIGDLGERNIWTWATLASAAIIKGEDERAIEYLGEAAAGASKTDLASIEGGLTRLAQEEPRLAKFRAALREPKKSAG